MGDYAPRVKLADEVRTLGIVVSRNPLELFRGRIERLVRQRGLSPFIRSPDIPRAGARRCGSAGSS